MKWKEIAIQFAPGPKGADPETAADLIALALRDFGSRGVIVQDPGDAKDHPDAAVIGHVPSGPEEPPDLKTLESRLAVLKKDLGFQARMSVRDIQDRDWAHSWKAHFQTPVSCGPFRVKPAWVEPGPADPARIIEIDPGMAFGTGTHPTTCLCMELIGAHVKKNSRFLDVGTGSGILMIAAAKMGAAHAAGTDTDPDALEIARKNLLLNGVPPHRFSLVRSHLASGLKGRFDVASANILFRPVLELIGATGRFLKKQKPGIFVCSGFEEADTDKVLEKMTRQGFEIIETRTRESWAAVCGKRA
ncbi:Ribosomal protein L11 methyltransferase [Candidatus Desulfarcum epimagneticum]|uniref:Ribosomal protein L11 methyltransferase n=1 Tax=uncultured Desulfobacteraceae bacterium TaxID=218296 RepID=A0A484HLE7_9BACT|nr:Ribosomal protein L11 methyltransferase [uncultured Desulfobacteraceae bacterium]